MYNIYKVEKDLREKEHELNKTFHERDKGVLMKKKSK